MHAEDTAELHHQLLDQLTAAITAATDRGDHDRRPRLPPTPRPAHRTNPPRRHRDAPPPATASTPPAPNSSPPPAAWTASSPNTTSTPCARKPCAPTPQPSTPPAPTPATSITNSCAPKPAAARSFAQNPAHNYDLDAADLDQLRAELDFLHAAERRQPRRHVHPARQPPLEGLDDQHRHAVSAITSSPTAVQLLHLHPGADKAATLAAIAATAHHHGHRVVALPARTTGEQHPYADTIAALDTAQTHFDAGRWTLPDGTLVVVDAADTLNHDQLRRIAGTIAHAGAKAILITSGEGAHADRAAGIAVLSAYLPHAQHLGDADSRHTAPVTALQQAEQHLAAGRSFEAGQSAAHHLIGQRDRILDRLRDTLAAVAELHRHTSASYEHERSHDNGLEL